MSSIIDFHTHIFPDALAPRAIAKLLEYAPNDRNFTNGTAAGLITSMKNSGISRSVTLPIATKNEQTPVIIKQQSKSDLNYFVPFGTMHPSTTDIAGTIELLEHHAIKGVKFHPEYQDFYLHDPRYFPLYEALSAAGIIVVIHAGKDPGPFNGDHATPASFIIIKREFPKLTIVAAHMGGWKIWDQISDTLCGLPLYFDTSAIYGFIDKNLFMRMVHKHGTDRILFGSDSPWFDQGNSVAWIDALPLSQNEKEKIFTKNAENLLSL